MHLQMTQGFVMTFKMPHWTEANLFTVTCSKAKF